MQNTNDLSNGNSTEINVDTRRSLGAIQAYLAITFLLLYLHVFYILVSRKLWRIHSFFLWFISLSTCDIANLLIYTWGSMVVLRGCLLLNLDSEIIIGHMYNFFFINSFLHFPIMAIVRTAGIAAPLKSRPWLTSKCTLIQISLIWISSIMLTGYAQKSRGNWVYYDPTIIGWTLAYEYLYDSALDAFWIAMPTLSVCVSFCMYSVCVYKLRKHTIQIMDSNMLQAQAGHQNQHHSAEAERNLIKINIMLFVVFTLDMIFWRVQSAANKAWWTPFALTLVEVSMYGVNAILLLVVSREIRKRSCLWFWILKCKCHTGTVHNVAVIGGARQRNDGHCGNGGDDQPGPSGGGQQEQRNHARFFPPAINLLVEKWSQVTLKSKKMNSSGNKEQRQSRV